MAWKLSSVPKVAHFFWDDSPMSFLRWMTLRSFSVLNPEWKLVLHRSFAATRPNWGSSHNKQVATEDLRDRVGDIKNLEIQEEDDEFAGLPAVQQSDILRNRYLFESGGIWSDMDILYYRPMDEMLCNIDENATVPNGLCIEEMWFPIGFMLSSPGSAFFEQVLRHQESIAKHAGRPGYQKFGTGVYKSVMATGVHEHFPVATTEVYQHMWGAHRRIFQGALNLNLGVGIHWYGGSDSAALHEPTLTTSTWKSHPMSTVIAVTA